MRVNGNIVDAIYKDSVKIKSYIMPIYNVRCTFATGKDIEKMAKKMGIHEKGHDYASYQGQFIETKQADGIHMFYILLKVKNNRISLPNLTHEIGHFCHAICNYVGIKMDGWNDEPITHMMEYTMDQFLEFIKKGPFIKLK